MLMTFSEQDRSDLQELLPLIGTRLAELTTEQPLILYPTAALLPTLLPQYDSDPVTVEQLTPKVKLLLRWLAALELTQCCVVFPAVLVDGKPALVPFDAHTGLVRNPLTGQDESVDTLSKSRTCLPVYRVHHVPQLADLAQLPLPPGEPDSVSEWLERLADLQPQLLPLATCHVAAPDRSREPIHAGVVAAARRLAEQRLGAAADVTDCLQQAFAQQDHCELGRLLLEILVGMSKTQIEVIGIAGVLLQAVDTLLRLCPDLRADPTLALLG